MRSFLFCEESGQGLVEYALLLIMASITAVLIIVAIGKKNEQAFADINGIFEQHESLEWKPM